MDSGIIESDFLVIGSGLAGLYTALNAAAYGTVTLVTKSDFSASSSYWAQGGVAAVLDPADSFESHIHDTLKAGRGYCDEHAVEVLIKEGAAAIQELISLGMNFDKSGLNFDLGLEGGHSARRIFHANGAATGKALIDFLLPQIISNPNIRVVEYGFVYNLLTRDNRCHGADFYSIKKKKNIRVKAAATMLATGGYSGLFSRTTNPRTSTGDGLWLAYNAGAVLKDMEFVQFHPTAFYSKTGRSFLISEAVRGEGARLMNQAGEFFMEAYPEGDLSPRDVVSKEIFRQMQHQQKPYVYLDVKHMDYQKIKRAFPGIISQVEAEGINIKNEGIPVAPAAHYCIGGIETSLDGCTAISGLYACGETAATGVHGANRLASNSLLECLVFGKRAVMHAAENPEKGKTADFAKQELVVNPDFSNYFLALKNNISVILNRYTGIERSRKGLQAARQKLMEAGTVLEQGKPGEYYFSRMEGMLNVAAACVSGAFLREESRGVHFRADFPETNKVPERSFRFKKHEVAGRKRELIDILHPV